MAVSEISHHIWNAKYRYREGDVVLDRTIEDSWRRQARALAGVEPRQRSKWERSFYEALEDFRFLPGGRIQAGAGTSHRVTLFNCFVMGVVEDSMDGIFEALKEGAITMQQGGGVGYDFSSLRPRGTAARATGTVASGPVSFMRIWDSMCATLLSTGSRRGAMMATLRCDHPDIERFVDAKADRSELRHFNLSVLVTDALVEAVRKDASWPLVVPVDQLADLEGERIERRLAGAREPVTCTVLRRLRARELWNRILRASYDYAEPGVLFIDRINRSNNLWYREQISATNPCGEIPLPPYGACNLGSINLTRFVREPFSGSARLDLDAMRATVRTATRMLDDVIDLSRFPLEKQAEQARGSRRIGLGLTGLGDALILLGLHYAEPRARQLAAEVMQTICHEAYRSSIDLAGEKGAFPFLDRERYLEGEFIRSLPAAIREDIAKRGIRNSHLTAIAPTGTISLLADNVSSGLEPVYRFDHSRKVIEIDGSYAVHRLSDFAVRLWREGHGQDPMPDCFVDALQLPPEAHLEMQAALQPFVDNAISKTINVPEDCDFADFRALYDLAYDRGLKGATAFRPNTVTGSILSGGDADELAAAHCCSIDREAD